MHRMGRKVLFFFLPCRIPRLTSLALEMGRTQSWLQQQMEGL